ncbi:hypothetical protein J4221_01410, partial [Candidatus Pacearchaeota archaeon]|nr:hypothetical protein [Candidatus Pacearchaeota archaeon]
MQEQHAEIRKILGEIKINADESEKFYADILLAESYRNLEGIEQASKEYDRIISSYSDIELKSEAYRLKSLALFSSDSRGYALDIYRGLYEAIRLGNKDASLTLL